MSRFVELSHTLTDGLRRQRGDGTWEETALRLRVAQTREESSRINRGLAAFESTEIGFPTAIGTYLDAPYCRYPNKRDIADLSLDDVVLPGVVVDCRRFGRNEAVPAAALPATDLGGHAVLFHFGWDRFWATPDYGHHPFVSDAAVDRLIAEGVKLAGMDTGSADGAGRPASPVHSRLLANDILIVENLVGLDRLLGRTFRFFAVPIKMAKATSMTVRAFAEVP